ncbi:calcium-binding protein [Marinobacterium sp. xm-a-152]|uniref:calcium-binding protein n=1 Tax=Marinobacterium sp. xm-a-152 TaxID=2497733 RepID=UPI001569C043|nr:calcium-binding protein [Marinobacterium sp. xm-a-152]NRP15406.1 Bifunctional hemolysin/adenylate cyclase precursor [Marinobacterium sp. xm-a-152]
MTTIAKEGFVDALSLTVSTHTYERNVGIFSSKESTTLEKLSAFAAITAAAIDATTDSKSPLGMTLGRMFGTVAFTTALAEVLEDFDQGEFELGNAIALVGTAASLVPGPHTAALVPLMALYPLADDFGEYLAEKGTLDPIFDLLLHQPDVELTWNDWEFAANDQYVEAPSFANAESITSPLVLDLDGDGVETIGIDQGVYFDHAGDGFAEKTGWVSPDDGVLAIDLNNNGKIDDGTELFGNNTQLSNGDKAANGFEALKEYDSNSDGVIDEFDRDFQALKVWQDLNLDGQTQEFELKTLEELGITSINLDYSEDSQQQQGNHFIQTSSFANTNSPSNELVDVWFQTDETQSIYQDSTQTADDLINYPDIKGWGYVANLQQVMAHNTELKSMVDQFIQESDPAARSALVNEIIYQWTGVADVDPYSRDPSRIYGHVMDARQLEALEELTAKDYVGTWCWGEHDPNPHGRAAPVLIAQFKAFSDYVEGQLNAQTHYAEAFDLIGVKFDSSTGQFAPDTENFEAHLQSLIDQNDLSQANLLFKTVQQLSSLSPAYDVVIDDLKEHPTLAPWLIDSQITGTDASETLTGSNADDLITGGLGDDRLFGGVGNDIYHYSIGDGSDQIYDSQGDDVLLFGEGISADNLLFERGISHIDIHLLNEDGAKSGAAIRLENVFDFDGSLQEGAIETLRFYDGKALNLSEVITHFSTKGGNSDDYLFGSDLADTLQGNQGNDTVYGGSGDDLYLFTQGDGQDTYIEHSGRDTIRIVGIEQSDQLTLRRIGTSGEDLLIQFSDQNGQLTGDQITIKQVYDKGIITPNLIETIELVNAEGVSTQLSTFELNSLYQSLDSNRLYGLEGDDRLQGADANEYLEGAGGDDHLIGNRGDDHLSGGEGGDLLVGGEGADVLQGGKGKDTYLFSRGHGQDVINNRDRDSIDRVLFDSTISKKQVDISRINDDLLIETGQPGDLITVKSFFNGDLISLDTIKLIEFSNGEQMNLSDIAQQTLATSNGDDHIQGLASADVISGHGGDDTISGGGGDDLIHGDQNNDLIYGDSGDDELFGDQGEDRLHGGSGSDHLFGGNESDQLYGGSGNDKLSGDNGRDHLFGGSGQDRLMGGNGDDQLTGGKGDDLLEGGKGDDTYIIRANDGSDQIVDSSGSDTIVLEGINWERLQLEMLNDSLLIKDRDSSTEVTIQSANKDGIERIETEDGWADMADIYAIIHAIAQFDALDEEEVTLEDRNTLNNVLATAWHSE